MDAFVKTCNDMGAKVRKFNWPDLVSAHREDMREVEEINAELLDALDGLVNAAEDFASSDPDMPSHKRTEEDYERAIEKARAAIKKARGE